MSELVEKVKRASKEGKVVYGYKKVLKSLLNGELVEVIICKNCPEEIREDIEHYAKLSKIQVNKINLNNMELGALIGRAHSVTVLGIKE